MPSTTFTTVGWSTWTVPTKVTNVTVTVDGAGSGSRPGGRVSGKIVNLTAGQKLYCLVGGAGHVNSGSNPGAASIGGGAAGGAGHSRDGGDGGGGASVIRLGSTTGTVKAVAGGAGGDSGDSGAGGPGGGTTGGAGGRGSSGSHATSAATGGTQAQGGNGGTSSAGAQFNGRNATDTILATGGAGGVAGPGVICHGGGGGGGGYHPGGGGQASSVDYAPGGGGGGGSSYTGGLSSPVDTQGGGGTGNGAITITWVSPSPANQPPTPPTEVKVNNVDFQAEMLTKATTSVKVSAKISDPDTGARVKMVARWANNSQLTGYKQVVSNLVVRNSRVEVTLTGLSQNTRYWVRLYTQDDHNLYSTSYTTIDFWTNRAPFTDSLTINGQGTGMTLPSISSATFSWHHNDPDIGDYQSGFELRYRIAASSTAAAGPWTVVNQNVGQNLPPKAPGPPSVAKNEWVFDPGTFKGNKFYEWTVRTKDQQGLWGDFPPLSLFTFFVSSTSAPPILQSPAIRTSVDVGKDAVFTWRFVDPDTGDQQVKADFRYRALGRTKEMSQQGFLFDKTPATAGEWITLPGDVSPGVPGGVSKWTIPAETFVGDYIYEWQVRTYDNIAAPPSSWSDSSWFFAIPTPGIESGPLPIGGAVRPQGSLGCGTYRVFIYEQGGQKRLGEIDPISHLTFSRLRDDISSCTTLSSGYSVDCGALYAAVRCWMHELVVFRDGVRVWEGPITRLAYTTTSVEFEAKDVMAYVYRRVMRQGYNDQYRLVKKGEAGQPDEYLGLESVVRRAAMLVTDALAPYDPNVLPYLTALEYSDDAQEARFVQNWSRSYWEEIDDLAATAGLDYTTVGRRILLWDTHRAVGRLPEMRDGDFSDSPIVTEYGMQLATFMAVTNGSGVVGFTEVEAKTVPYGPIELLASSYNDTAAATAEIQTPEQLAAAQKTLTDQAQRNISGRWPSPLIVRIPDNSTLSPKANVGFQQLIPGVWLPLRSVNTPRQVVQWQKLDSVSVEVDEKGEKVHVVLSPAPNGGNDPDADSAAAEADT